MILAPQRHNTSTASVEVFTLLTTPPDEWRSFRQLVVDRWTSYKGTPSSGSSTSNLDGNGNGNLDANTNGNGNAGEGEGEFINARPHWAKQWWDLEVRGEPIEKYLKEVAYRDAFEEFRRAFKAIVESRGGDVGETRERFGTGLMERLIFE